MRDREKTLSGNLKRRVEPLSSAPRMGNSAASHFATYFHREVDCQHVRPAPQEFPMRAARKG